MKIKNGEFVKFNVRDIDKKGHFEVPQGVTKIGDRAFADGFNSSTFKKVTIPEGVTEIGMCAFEGCVTLEKINLPKGLISFKEFAFSECLSLKEITLPDSVRRIGYFSFSECSSLEKIIISEDFDFSKLIVNTSGTKIKNESMFRSETNLPEKTEIVRVKKNTKSETTEAHIEDTNEYDNLTR